MPNPGERVQRLTTSDFLRARRKNLIVTHTGDDCLIFDSASNTMHRLNPLASAVWGQCDAATSPWAMAGNLGEDLPVIESVLAELEAVSLVESGRPVERGAKDRRGLLRRAGAVALIPTVVSVSAPLAASAQSAQMKCYPAADVSCSPGAGLEACCLTKAGTLSERSGIYGAITVTGAGSECCISRK